MATRVHLRVHWEDESEPTVLEFTSKAAAIDWLASQADRPMSVATLTPVTYETALTDEQLLRIPPRMRVTKDRTLEQARRERFEASERLKAKRAEAKCICRVKGVADLLCPVHGINGTAPFSDGQE